MGSIPLKRLRLLMGRMHLILTVALTPPVGAGRRRALFFSFIGSSLRYPAVPENLIYSLSASRKKDKHRKAGMLQLSRWPGFVVSARQTRWRAA